MHKDDPFAPLNWIFNLTGENQEDGHPPRSPLEEAREAFAAWEEAEAYLAHMIDLSVRARRDRRENIDTEGPYMNEVEAEDRLIRAIRAIHGLPEDTRKRARMELADGRVVVTLPDGQLDERKLKSGRVLARRFVVRRRSGATL